MNKNLVALVFLFVIGKSDFAQGTMATRTSVTNGNFSNPLTWDCTCVPIPSDVIIVNHDVTLNLDYGFSSGSLTVNTGASLIGDISSRAFGITGGSFANNGTVQLGDFYHGGGSFSNTGTFTALNAFAIDMSANTITSGTFVVNDTLYVNTNATFANSGNATVYSHENAGTTNNTGSIVGTDLYNSGTFNNTSGIGITFGSLYTSGTFSNTTNLYLVFDLWNSGIFTNSNHMVIDRNFWNGDTLLGSATLTNNGTISVANDLSNSQIMNGSGDYCVANSSYNSGTVSGTLDVCDLTGTNFDTNIGSIAGTVTFCSAGSCMIGMDEAMNNEPYKLFPNPFNNEFTIDMKTSGAYKFILLNSVGQIVLENSFTGTKIQIELSTQAKGIFHYRIVGENRVLSGKLVKE